MTRWNPRATPAERPAADSGIAADAMAQYGCPQPIAVASEPASPTATTYIAPVAKCPGIGGIRCGTGVRRLPACHVRARNQPAKPTAIAQAAEATATSAGTEGAVASGVAAQAPKAKMPKNGPTGRRRRRSVTTEPTPGTSVSRAKKPQAPTFEAEARIPAITQAHRNAAAGTWWNSLNWRGSPRPYMPVKQPNTAYMTRLWCPVAGKTREGMARPTNIRHAPRCSPPAGGT